MSSRKIYNPDSEREESVSPRRTYRTTSPVRGDPVGRTTSPDKGSSYRVSSVERGTSPRRAYSTSPGSSVERTSTPDRVSSTRRSISPKRVIPPIRRRQKYAQEEKSIEEKRFEAGINIGRYNMSQTQERKMSD